MKMLPPIRVNAYNTMKEGLRAVVPSTPTLQAAFLDLALFLSGIFLIA